MMRKVGDVKSGLQRGGEGRTSSPLRMLGAANVDRPPNAALLISELCLRREFRHRTERRLFGGAQVSLLRGAKASQARAGATGVHADSTVVCLCLRETSGSAP